MYYLFGCHAIHDLLRTRCAARADLDFSDRGLRTAYNDFLGENSIIEVPIDWCEPRLVDFEQLQCYAPTFCAEKQHHFALNSDVLRARISNGYFEAALEGLREKEPDLSEIARFCVRLIVINQLSEYTNGTTEDTLGVANFNFHDDFDELDFQELLIHQLVHMLLFIDDTLTPQMQPGCKETPIETGLPFVLGGTTFPAYLAFHSYIVAVEMLLYRNATNQWDACPKYHRSTARMIRIIDAFKAALGANASLFTDRGQDMLRRAEAAVAPLVGATRSATGTPPQ